MSGRAYFEVSAVMFKQLLGLPYDTEITEIWTEEFELDKHRPEKFRVGVFSPDLPEVHMGAPDPEVVPVFLVGAGMRGLKFLTWNLDKDKEEV